MNFDVTSDIDISKYHLEKTLIDLLIILNWLIKNKKL